MNKNDLIKLLIKNEESLAKLYKLYSQKYDNYADFWNRLSDDEKTHAQKIKSFSEKDNVKVNSKKINKQDIDNLFSKVEEAILELDNKVPPIEKALKKALGFENNLSEKKYFEVFESESETVNFYLKEMSEAVVSHKDRIKKMLDKI